MEAGSLRRAHYPEMNLRKTFTAAAVALVALLATACSDTEKANEGPYPREVKDNFVDTCSSAARRQQPQGTDTDRRNNCRCVIDALEKRLPYAKEGPDNDFKEADRAAREGRPLPAGLRADFDQATASCAS